MTAFSSPALALLLALLALLSPPPVSAQVDDGLATVRLDGRALFRIGATGELEARQRARLIERQLLAVLEVPEGIAKARIAPAGENGEARQISVAGRTLMQVFEDDAQANGQTLDAQAREWASVLHRLLQEVMQCRV